MLFIATNHTCTTTTLELPLSDKIAVVVYTAWDLSSADHDKQFLQDCRTTFSDLDILMMSHNMQVLYGQHVYTRPTWTDLKNAVFTQMLPKATIVTKFVNKEISSLATKTMKVACYLCHEATVSEADVGRRYLSTRRRVCGCGFR